MLAEGSDVDVPDSNVGVDQNSLDIKLWGVKRNRKVRSIEEIEDLVIGNEEEVIKEMADIIERQSMEK
ncbi:hypothetical protein GOBAR_AA28156 [Gossypium barbadense]|uniref:Uncharacterized protein n=1 Tax=Gossypium barbadense TaxID=3634 RepID=A0A2P5WN65_GOSBA|nr:hypothetical protein GOBAR_AA28156 [Gossypium barbadense]